MFNWLIVESNWLCGYLAQRSWVFLIFAFFNVCLFYEFGFLFHSFVCLVFYFIHFFVCCSCLCGYSRFLPFFNVCLFISSFFYFIHLFVCGLFVHSFVCLCIFNFLFIFDADILDGSFPARGRHTGSPKLVEGFILSHDGRQRLQSPPAQFRP